MAMNLNQLKTLRDELKLKAHLFNAEMRQSWEKVEKELQALQSEAKKVAPSAKLAFTQSATALEPLLAQVETSLVKIREAFERQNAK
ncbi:MAG: hypothetical protein ACXWP5_10165 [Bdellovibrionota bacterium]